MGNALWRMLAPTGGQRHNITTVDEMYCTLSCKSIAADDASTANCLLDRAMDVNHLSSDSGLSPLHVSVERGNVECLDHLISRLANVNIVDCRRFTPLHLLAGAARPNMECCQVLVENGADIDAQDVWGKTPLHRAVIYNNPDVATFLLQSGCSVDKADNLGRTPLSVLANNVSLVKSRNTVFDTFLAHGANLNSKDLKWKSPICHAVLSQNIPMLEKLREIESKLDFSRTVSLALSRCYADCLDIVLSLGAKVPRELVRDKLVNLEGSRLSNNLEKQIRILRTLLCADGRCADKQMVLEVVASLISVINQRGTPVLLEAVVPLICTLIAMKCLALGTVWPVLNINASIACKVQDALGYNNMPTLAMFCRTEIRDAFLRYEPNAFYAVERLVVLPAALRCFLLFEEY